MGRLAPGWWLERVRIDEERVPGLRSGSGLAFPAVGLGGQHVSPPWGWRSQFIAARGSFGWEGCRGLGAGQAPLVRSGGGRAIQGSCGDSCLGAAHWLIKLEMGSKHCTFRSPL